MMESFVYLGSIDDAVERCPFGTRSRKSRERVEVKLLRHALFGGIMILHEGYLVHNKEIRQILLSKENIIKDLIKAGRIIFLSRNSDIIADEIDKSHAGTLTSSRIDIDNVRPTYDDLSGYVSQFSKVINSKGRGSFIQEIDDTEIIASRIRKFILIDLISSCADPHDLHLIGDVQLFEKFRECFLANIRSMSPRTAWEEAIFKQTVGLANQNIIVRSYMTLANEVYHIVAAATISAQHNIDVKVETAYSRRLSNYIPYKASAEQTDLNHLIKVPLQAILENRSLFIDSLFNDGPRAAGCGRYHR